MSWDVILLPKAHEDRLSAISYLSNFYPSTPLKFENALQRAKDRLAEDPYGPSAYYDMPVFRRVIIEKKYTMFYIIDEERHEVHIHRILRSSWDLPRILRNAEEE